MGKARGRGAAATVTVGVVLLAAGCTTSQAVDLTRTSAASTVRQGAAPADLAVEVSGHQATISWSPPPGAEVTSYQLHLDTDPAVDIDGATTVHVLEELGSGRHLVQVTAMTAEGTSTAAHETFEVGYTFAAPSPASPTETATPSAAPTAAPVVAAPVAAAPAPTATVTVTATPTSTPPATQTGAGAAAPAPAAPTTPPSTRPIVVDLHLVQGAGYDVTEGETAADACTGGRDGFSDISIGTTVTVKGATGTIIDTGKVNTTSFDESGRDEVPVPPTDDPTDEWGNVDTWPVHLVANGFCTYTAAFDIPREPFYTVEVSGRGEQAISDADLSAAGDRVSFNLGS